MRARQARVRQPDRSKNPIRLRFPTRPHPDRVANPTFFHALALRHLRVSFQSIGIFLSILTSLSACAGRSGPRSEDQAGGRRSRDAHVIDAEALGRMGSATLLQALTSRVPAMQVAHRPGTHCPSIVLRGVKTVLGRSDPAIYIDGTPAVDTCILEQLRVQDVDHVEVYPSGLAPMPGYPSDPYGIILVFLRDGQSGGSALRHRERHSGGRAPPESITRYTPYLR